MPTSTVEDYLKAILIQQQPLKLEQLVTMRQIGLAVAVAPGTVTAMVKTLEKDGLLSYEPYAGVRLTGEGQRMALHVLRRHRLIELFLVEMLGLDWSEVHEEAETLEHAISDKLINRIDKLLGYPSVDPHGDPIPDAEGMMREPRPVIGLMECQEGRDYRISRVSDQDEEFLRFIERHGLKPGTRIAIENCEPVADAVTLRPHGGQSLTVGGEAAAKLWVEPLHDESKTGELMS